jgi:hypothetical protein
MQRYVIASLVCFWMVAAASAFGQTVLFEKKNLADWDFYVDKEGVKVEDVFSFSNDGRLLCTGKPFGYLATKESYKNFKLSLEWCWSQGKEPTNSGIFLKITDQPKGAFLPKTVEVQLHHKNAGDVWAFHGRTIIDSGDRFASVDSPDIGKFTGVKKVLDAEKAPGQWNNMEILCIEGLLVIVVNGNIVNWTTGAEAIKGRIGFQSEGGPVEFRNAVLTVLP